MADNPFRTILVVGLLLIFPVGVYHRIRSQATGERLDRRQEGLFILATLRPVAFLFGIGLVTYLVEPARMAWSSWPLPAAVRWSGAAVLAIAGGLVIWTFRTLGPNLTDTVVTRRQHALVTRGPYQFVRHPFYVSTGLLLVACSLMSANWFLLVTGSAALGLLVMRTRTEEEKLVARFGDAYRDYMIRTGRFWPRARGHRAGV